MSWRDYGARLARAGLVTDPVLPERALPSAPWYLQAVSALGAWFAALLLLGALGGPFYGLLSSRGGRGVLGAVLCAAVAAVMRARPAARERSFVAQFGLAVSLAGLALVGSALADLAASTGPNALLLGAAAMLLWWLNPEPVHRTLCALLAAAALAVALLTWRLEPLATLLTAAGAAVAWLRQAEFHARGRGELSDSLALACTLSLLLLQAVDVLDRGVLDEPGLWKWSLGSAPWRAAVLSLVMAGVAALLARRLRLRLQAAHWVALLVVSAALAWSGRYTPGVVASVLVWLLGSAAGRARLCAVALVALAAYLALLYYAMDRTLMDKGLVLIGSGLLLGLGAWLLGRAWPIADPSVTKAQP